MTLFDQSGVVCSNDSQLDIGLSTIGHIRKVALRDKNV
jgi:hypothetical protein